MGEYLGSVVVMSAILGIISYVSYPSGSEKTVRFAASVLLLYTALTPLLGFVSKITSDDISSLIGDFDYKDEVGDGEYIIVAENAFKEGISKLLFAKYGINEEDSEVFVFGFDFENMRAEKIKIQLSGGGSTADFRGIENYITESGLGECEVNLKIG